ncbi:hypothetical protein [Streptomyces sp. NPDC002825]|uniref:hypothetical protein n=1 Tax=Streptomyces sp. NPDC002825 TaxID=3154666 RepID=UPI00331B424B
MWVVDAEEEVEVVVASAELLLGEGAAVAGDPHHVPELPIGAPGDVVEPGSNEVAVAAGVEDDPVLAGREVRIW